MGNNRNGYLNYNLKIVTPDEDKKYFVYRHIRLDTNEVFYVGFGKMNNAYPSRATKVYSRNRRWNEIVKTTDWYAEIIFQSDDKDEISNKEIEFIKLYGIIDEGGTLCNRSTGGDKNYKFSDEKRKEMSLDFINYWKNKTHPMKGIPKTKEHRSKLSENAYRRKTIYCETNGKEYSSIKKCIIDIFGEFKKGYENGIRDKFKLGLPYKGYTFHYNYNKNAK